MDNFLNEHSAPEAIGIAFLRIDYIYVFAEILVDIYLAVDLEQHSSHSADSFFSMCLNLSLLRCRIAHPSSHQHVDS